MGDFSHIVIGKPNATTVQKLAANLGLSEPLITSRLAKIPHIHLNQPPEKHTNPYLSKIPQGTGRDKSLKPDNGYNLLGNSLGNPVWSNLSIQAGSYTDYNNKTASYPRIDFDAVLLTVTIPKRIVKTEIQGRDGAVKEYIGKDDAQISIAGVITGTNGSYPIDFVNQFYRVMNAPVAIGVVSSYLQNLDIHSIVVESVDMPQNEGGYSYQQFTVNAVSDTPHELRINGL